MDMKANAAGIESNKAACYCAISADFRKPADGSAIDQPYRGERDCLNGSTDIHSVANPAMAARAAVSLHLYSHPYVQCDIYDLEKNEKRRVRLRYDSIDRKVIQEYKIRVLRPNLQTRLQLPS